MKTKEGKPRITWAKTKVQYLVRCLPSGTYYARLRLNGKPVRQALGTDNFEAAKLKLADYLRQARTPKPEGKCPSLSQMWPDFELSWKPDLAERTKAYYREIWGSFKRGHKSSFKGAGAKRGSKDTAPDIWPEFFSKPLVKLTRQDCQAWYRDYCQDFSTSRSNAALGILNIIFEIAIEQRRRMDNPARVLKRQSQYASDEDRRVERNELPTDEQLAHIRQCLEIDEPESAVLFKLLLNTGCRVDSAGNILWKHVDWDRGEVLIAKAKRGPYRIPLFPPLRLFLENLKKSRVEIIPDSPVSSVKSIKKSLARAAKSAGFEKACTHHTLRHVFTTRCIEDGIDDKTIASWLGYKDGGELVRKVYGHLRPAHVDAQIQKMKIRDI